MQEILDSIKKKTDKDIDGETVRRWSRQDIERLLEVTRRDNGTQTEKQEEAPEENIYVAEASYKDDISEIIPNLDDEDILAPELGRGSVSDRIKELMNGEPKKDDDKKRGSAKEKAVALADKIKGGSKRIFASLKTAGKIESEENLPQESDDEFEDDVLEAEYFSAEDEDDDIKIADFSETKKSDESFDTKQGAEKKTLYIETPGLVIKKGGSDEENDLEGAPMIMAADDVLENDAKSKIPTIEKMGNDINSKIREAHESGQMIIQGFEKEGDKIKEETLPERIDETDAERELFEKRKKKIDKFTLFGEDSDPYGSDSDKERIGELFDTHDEKHTGQTQAKTFDGIEYEQTKDARRVQRFLNLQKKDSSRRVAALITLFVFSLIVGTVSAAGTTVGGDNFLTIFFNLLIIMVALVVSGQSIFKSFEVIKQKKFNVSTMASITAIVCFIQNLLMFVMYFFKDKNAVSVFGSAGVGLLLLTELSSHLMNCRTADAMEMCSGSNRDILYSIESISDGKDVSELGKNVRARSPRIRYSCKTKFPSHLIEMCTGETSADKKARLYFAAAVLVSLINFIVAWVVGKKFTVGFAAFTITLALSVPAYASLLIQLPLCIVNKEMNRKGSMLSGQDAVNEIYRTNAIVLDSKDLFDSDACAMTGFKDFKTVRMDSAMLYAAAMVIRSGGPLVGAFDNIVVNRHILPAVKSFAYEEKLGVSGWINNQKVILGNRAMMKNHSIDVPASVDEEKYTLRGLEIMYLAIANSLAAMMVVDYAPNTEIAEHLRMLRDNGVTVLVRNCDPNVTERMISEHYDMRLDNIKIISSASGRVFKKYKSRPKTATRAVAIHDGSTYTLANTLCSAASLRHSFKVGGLLTDVGVALGFLMIFALSVMGVVVDFPVIFILLVQAIMAGAFAGITKLSCGK